MFNITDIEKTIDTMRTQAKALNAGADALEQSLVPIKAAQAVIDVWNNTNKTMFDFWSGKTNLDLTKPIKPFIIYDDNEPK